MSFTFDLISDLHLETWGEFAWSGQSTSPYCVVAGDIARDTKLVTEALRILGNNYYGVFYIDGNDEHRYHYSNLSNSYQQLINAVSSIKNVVYLRNNVVTINGVAVVSANGWWSYDFNPTFNKSHCINWTKDELNISYSNAEILDLYSINDSAYITSTIKKLQLHEDVKSIVVVTHTVPGAWLVDHDIQLSSTERFNALGNSGMLDALKVDTKNKIHTWCFGHYHQSVDRIANGIRYVNNCRGRGNTPWCQHAYYPKKIEID
jgi:UDP-2,3-diacylglucosamine pyrophosphatase LpxH